MNDSWTTMAMTTAMMMQNRRPAEEVSHSDIAALLKGRTYGQSQDTPAFNMNPSVPEFDPAEMQELQDFCAKRGIIGVNFGGMNPRAVLNMLKTKMGIREQTTKKGLLNG